MFEESVKFWHDVVMYGGEYKDDGIDFTAEVNLGDKNSSSLKQLHTYLGKLAAAAKAKEDRMKAQWQDIETLPADSTIMLPK
jgi:hypothetical protein